MFTAGYVRGVDSLRHSMHCSLSQAEGCLAENGSKEAQQEYMLSTVSYWTVIW